MKRGYVYTTSFEIRERPSNELMDLDGVTATFVVGSKEFPAVIENPGVVNATLTPTQTKTVPTGRHEASCKITIGSNAYGPYGVHTITVK